MQSKQYAILMKEQESANAEELQEVNVQAMQDNGTNDEPKVEVKSEETESSAEESEEAEKPYAIVENEDGTSMVRVGNFIVLKDKEKEHPYITVTPISRAWYVGYAPGSMVREYLETTLFADEPPTDTDVASVIMFLTGVMAGATILNAGFTNNIIKAVQEMVETAEPTPEETEENKE